MKTMLNCSVVLSLLALILLPVPAGYAAATIKGSGQLTEFVSETLVRIDGRGYLVNRNTRVFDGQGNEVLLYRLTFPKQVKFRFKYTSDGPEVMRIDVSPQ